MINAGPGKSVRPLTYQVCWGFSWLKDGCQQTEASAMVVKVSTVPTTTSKGFQRDHDMPYKTDILPAFQAMRRDPLVPWVLPQQRTMAYQKSMVKRNPQHSLPKWKELEMMFGEGNVSSTLANDSVTWLSWIMTYSRMPQNNNHTKWDGSSSRLFGYCI